MENVKIAIYDLGVDDNKYVQCLRQCGAQVLPFKYVDDSAEAQRIAGCCDGLLLPGGGDINPTRYGAARKSSCGQPDDMRDRVELLLLDAFVRAEKPVLGICRGAQVICVHFGGTLYQDISSEAENNSLNHFFKEDYTADVHEVEITENSCLHEITGLTRMFTNSVHHQSAKQLPPTLSCCARASDGVVEAVCHNTLPFVLGIQWHPERLAQASEPNRRIFESFVDVCAQSMRPAV